ncbi:hypothetical protein MW290_27875 [Aquincola tertiaricarbonis]|uniref:Uncharacterized protein n=1 Tax=Aquincola tertiaricarbonis TaxID=391953 RepID=A0ABY4SBW3_AQUTE|nr:hypothetical protein [Aquincola tertiaricarbonis]URI09387.1 hypothetical protein MW290_27875 [Aquincola tertiaricarbonis]
MANAASSLKKFAVKPADEVSASATPGILPTRGKNKRVGIAVRLSPADWHRATELAMREQTSLQRLLVAGVSELLRQRGLPPLSGD